MNTTERKIGSFQAKYADGREETIDIFQSFHSAHTLSGPTGEVAGLKRLCTRGGVNVNRRDKGQYELTDFNSTPLTSDDPNAP